MGPESFVRVLLEFVGELFLGLLFGGVEDFDALEIGSVEEKELDGTPGTVMPPF